MKEILKRGATSNILRVFLADSASTTGAGKTGLTNTSTGLIISTIADNEATATTYTAAASNTETITTLGTYSAPSSGKARFKEVDATNFPGVYEIQIADARFNVSNSTQLLVSIQATGVAPTFAEIQLVTVDLYDAIRFGLTALPNAAAEASGGLITRGTGTGQLSVTTGAVTVGTNNDKTNYSLSQAFPSNFSSLAITSTGIVTANTTQLAGSTVTASTGVTFPASVGTSTLTSSEAADAVWGANITNSSVPAAWGNDTMGKRLLRSDSNTRADVLITGTSPDPGKLAADVYNIQDGKITAASIADSGANDIADATLKRSIRDADGGVEKSAADYSLATTILGMLENSISGTTLTIYESDGTTTHLTRSLGVADASTADVITSVS